MCTTCGCEEATHEHDHHHHDHGHDHDHEHVVIDVLAKSRRLAADNRAWFRDRGLAVVNLMSAPGAGKTTLLEHVARAMPIHVVEGDQATAIDADRVRAAGARAVQVNTGVGCHLDPHMVRHAVEDLRAERGSLVIVENVGNLVCPALFDLGEAARVVLLSTPEGDDKPLKYPHMFADASLVVITKSDLLPYVSFDVSRCRAHLPAKAKVMELSTKTGAGLDRFIGFLREVHA